MARGRIPRTIRSVPWTIHIEEPTAHLVELLLLDPSTGRARLGERSKLLTRLLKDWIAAQRQQVGANHDINPN